MKRTPMKRTGIKRGSTRIAQQSERRREQAEARREVVQIVLKRDGVCQYARVIPEVPCSSPFAHRPPLEVDELRGGSHRSIEYLNPDACVAVCQTHHDIKTDGRMINGVFVGKREVLRRLRALKGAT